MSKKENEEKNAFEKYIKYTEKPLFTYNQNQDYNEAWNKFKKKPFTKETTTFYIKVFVLITIICFFISKLLHIPINNIIHYTIFISFTFILSLIINIQLAKLKFSNMLNWNRLYFYDNFLIIETKNSIIPTYYNKFKAIDENETSFIIIYETNTIIIRKKEIDNHFIEFLKNIKSNYKQKQDKKGNDKNLLDYLEIKGAKVSCNNNINDDTINLYCNTKKEKQIIFKQVYFYNLIIESIAILTLAPPPNEDILFCLFFIPILVFILNIIIFNSYINTIQKKIKKYNESKASNNFKYYFYDNFIIIKTNTDILKIKYKNINCVYNSEKYYFIKFKYSIIETLFTPLIIEKNKLSEKDLTFLNKKLLTKNN